MSVSSEYLASRLAGHVANSVTPPESLHQAYRIQKQNTSKIGAVTGWKLGGTNLATREVFETDELYFGPLFQGSVYRSAEQITLPSHILEPKGELEICFELSEAVDQERGVEVTTANVSKFVQQVWLGVEVPWSVYPQPQSGLNVLVADCCASGALVIHPADTFNADSQDQVAIRAKTTSGVAELAAGAVSNILGGPLGALIDSRTSKPSGY